MNQLKKKKKKEDLKSPAFWDSLHKFVLFKIWLLKNKDTKKRLLNLNDLIYLFIYIFF